MGYPAGTGMVNLMFLNKTIVITGASSGLGAALAKELAAFNPNLVLFSRNLEKLNEVVKECNDKGSNTIAVQGDTTKPEDCKKLLDETLKSFGSVDHLVLNAGVSMWAKFEEINDLSFFNKLIETNYLSAVYLSHLFIPHLIKTKGMITAISSIQGDVAVPNHTGYVASKHALTGFLNTLRMELKKSGVDILLVKPHWLRGTDLRKNAFDKNGNRIGESKKEHNKESITLEECSRKIIQGMQGRKRELVIPPKLKLLEWLNLISPGLAERIVSGKVKEQE
jgi:short-subunit dehydrogenase